MAPREHHTWAVNHVHRHGWIVLFSLLLLSKCLILEFGKISIQNRNWPEMKVKAKCARALIRYLKAKESERENSNELCKTKLYYATCRQRVCGQNKNNLCLHAARTLRAKRTLIWRSCAFNRRPMTMPVLDGVKPVTLPVCGTSEPD